MKLPIHLFYIRREIKDNLLNHFPIYPHSFNKKEKTADLCVVVGYSFRDDQIRRIFFEMSKNNDSLIILLISPNAGEIFRSQLEYYDDERKIPSPLSEKVICWNYCFGSTLKENYLYQNLEPQISLLKALKLQLKMRKK